MLKSFESDPFFHYFEISIPIRLGYIFDFKLMQYDAFVNLQAEFNTSIYRAFLIDDDIALESFEKKYKIIFPLVSFGIKL